MREKKALELAAQQAERVNKDVSMEAQCIFDALSKTLPCDWQGNTIVVLVSVAAYVCLNLGSVPLCDVTSRSQLLWPPYKHP